MMRVWCWAGACALTIASAASGQVDTVLPEDEDRIEAASSEGASYPDGRGGEIFFPRGDQSFADEARGFRETDRYATRASARDPDAALGPPDYSSVQDGGYVTLSCGGVLELAFTDNVLVDIEGDDLYIFEIGPDVEGMSVAISDDGESWTEVGEVGGSTAALDIADTAEPGVAYRYVRLTDGREACDSSWPGADVDAVGAIGSGQRIMMEGNVLFDVNEATLRNDAIEALESVHAAIMAQDGARVIIEGYTDDTGDADYNMDLSERRAAAVHRHLEELSTRPNDNYESLGYGETRPAAPNDTPENRAINRRVEILILRSASAE